MYHTPLIVSFQQFYLFCLLAIFFCAIYVNQRIIKAQKPGEPNKAYAKDYPNVGYLTQSNSLTVSFRLMIFFIPVTNHYHFLRFRPAFTASNLTKKASPSNFQHCTHVINNNNNWRYLHGHKYMQCCKRFCKLKPGSH